MKTELPQTSEIEGDFPRYGNDDDRADEHCEYELLSTFMEKLKHMSYLP